MRGLGYERYGAGGGDFGAGVATFMALDEPEPMIGVHLTNLEIPPYTGAGLAAAVRRRAARTSRSEPALGRGRARLQRDPVDEAADARLRAQRLARRARRLDPREVALVDRHRRRPRRALRARLPADDGDALLGHRDDHVLDARLLRQPLARRRARPGRPRRGCRPRSPSSPHQFVPEGEPPREWAERLYDVRRWTPMPSGGHFAPAEEPELRRPRHRGVLRRSASDAAARFGRVAIVTVLGTGIMGAPIARRLAEAGPRGARRGTGRSTGWSSLGRGRRRDRLGAGRGACCRPTRCSPCSPTRAAVEEVIVGAVRARGDCAGLALAPDGHDRGGRDRPLRRRSPASAGSCSSTRRCSARRRRPRAGSSSCSRRGPRRRRGRCEELLRAARPAGRVARRGGRRQPLSSSRSTTGSSARVENLAETLALTGALGADPRRVPLAARGRAVRHGRTRT